MTVKEKKNRKERRAYYTSNNIHCSNTHAVGESSQTIEIK